VLDKAGATDEVLAALRPEGRESAPFVCAGDFNGDGVPDVAAIVRDRRTHKLSLMAFHGTRGGDYQAVIVADLSQILLEPGKKIDQYLVCEKPGIFREPNGSERSVTTNSIVRAFEGKAAILYYWGDPLRLEWYEVRALHQQRLAREARPKATSK